MFEQTSVQPITEERKSTVCRGTLHTYIAKHQKKINLEENHRNISMLIRLICIYSPDTDVHIINLSVILCDIYYIHLFVIKMT